MNGTKQATNGTSLRTDLDEWLMEVPATESDSTVTAPAFLRLAANQVHSKCRLAAKIIRRLPGEDGQRTKLALND
jgi:hypothetical protein